MNSTERRIRDFVVQHQGDTMLSERDLARRLDATRGQVRDVLLHLEGEGLLRRCPQRGYSYVDYDQADEGIAHYLRFFIEQEAARLALDRITPDDLRRLDEMLARLKAMADGRDFPRYAKLDAAFHTALVGLSGDNLLIHLFSYVSMVLFPVTAAAAARFAEHREYFATTHQHHQQIVKALRQGNAEMLRIMLNIHLGLARLNQWMGEQRVQDFLAAVPPAHARRHRTARWTPKQMEQARQYVRSLDFSSPAVAGLVVLLEANHHFTGDALAELFGVSASSVDRLIRHFRWNDGTVPEATRGRGHALLSPEAARALFAPLAVADGGVAFSDLRVAAEKALKRPIRPNYLYKLLAHLGWRKGAREGRSFRWLPPTDFGTTPPAP